MSAQRLLGSLDLPQVRWVRIIGIRQFPSAQYEGKANVRRGGQANYQKLSVKGQKSQALLILYVPHKVWKVGKLGRLGHVSRVGPLP